MTSQGHAYARFQRALKTGNPAIALAAARELNHVTLEDALGLCLLLRHVPRRYQRAAARWIARYHADIAGVTLTDIRQIADLLAAVPIHGQQAAADLASELHARGLARCARTVQDIMAEPPSQSVPTA